MSVHSVFVAKERLKNLLISDRIQCTPDAADRLTKDLYLTVSKYMEINPDHLTLRSQGMIYISNTREKTSEIIFKKPKDTYNIRDYKLGVVVPVIVLSIIGVLMVRSARPDLMGRQMLGVLLGIGAMIVISLIDYKWVLNFYWPMYFLNLILLAAIWIPGLGVESNGARRWLNLGITQLQPSDLTKILMILFFARFLSDRERSINNPR